jgi:hypothetical protein
VTIIKNDMATVTIKGLTNLQANAITMWAESGGLSDAFEESHECSLIPEPREQTLLGGGVEYATGRFEAAENIVTYEG